MNGILSLLVMCFAVTHSLFMNSANSSYLTAHDFRQLLDLLMEEKHLRGQLENRVNQLEQELHTNEGKVDAFNQAITKEKSNRHQLETAYTRLLMSFHNLSSDDNALRADHAKEIARNNELEKRFLNLTKDAMEKFKLHEHEIKNILNKTLDQGLSNKTKIMIRAINQSVRNNVSNINKRVITLEATISSIAANMTRNHRVITTIEAENMDIRSNLSKCQAILIRNKAEIALLGANFSSLHGGVFTINSSVLKSVALTFSNQLEGRIAANEAKISTIQGNVTQNLASIAAHGRTLSSLNTDIQQLKQKAGFKDGFSAIGSQHGPLFSSLSFSAIKANIGSRYNSTTGKYTCHHSGYYYFVVHIVKDRYAPNARCDIMKNGSPQVRVAVVPDNAAEDGLDVGSNSVILHLVRGDFVNLGACSLSSRFYSSETSFTGFLISPD